MWGQGEPKLSSENRREIEGLPHFLSKPPDKFLHAALGQAFLESEINETNSQPLADAELTTAIHPFPHPLADVRNHFNICFYPMH